MVVQFSCTFVEWENIIQKFRFVSKRGKFPCWSMNSSYWCRAKSKINREVSILCSWNAHHFAAIKAGSKRFYYGNFVNISRDKFSRYGVRQLRTEVTPSSSVIAGDWWILKVTWSRRQRKQDCRRSWARVNIIMILYWYGRVHPCCDHRTALFCTGWNVPFESLISYYRVVWNLSLTQAIPEAATSRVGSLRINPRFHPAGVGWNLVLTRKLPTPATCHDRPMASCRFYWAASRKRQKKHVFIPDSVTSHYRSRHLGRTQVYQRLHLDLLTRGW